MVHVTQPVEAGVAVVALAHARSQQAAGLRVTLVCPEGPLVDAAAAAGVARVAWQATRSPGPTVPGEARSLAKVLSGLAPDLVHLHSAKAGLAGRLALRGRVPTAFQPHAWSFEAVTGPVRVASTAWERLAVRWTDLYVACSEDEARAARAAGLRLPSTVVVGNGLDLADWPSRTEADRSAARAALHLTDHPLVVCVGRLSRQKGQDVLLAAWPAVRAAVPTAQLLLVGDGPAAEALHAQAAALPGVTFAGARPDVREHLLAADVAVLPSRWEGLALALLEAMACSLPVVATEVAGARVCLTDALAQEQVAAGGVVVPVDDPAALAAALVPVLLDPAHAEQLGAAARSRVERAFTFEAVARHVRAAYLPLLAKGR